LALQPQNRINVLSNRNPSKHFIMKYFSIKKDILATIAYFNIFDFPLKKNEIFLYLGHCDNYTEFEKALNFLAAESVIFRIGDFYSLHNNPALAGKRQNGYEKAKIILRKAERAAYIISAFPFVQGVAISGSLSKYYADENTDVDFFIITASNRLWIARTLLHIFKKFTYLFGIEDLFCMNYFIDEAELVILEKNIYTATEIATILPLRGKDTFDSFFKANNWTRTYFPNKHVYLSPVKETKKSWFRSLMEIILANRMGDLLDNLLMKMTEKSWNNKTSLNKKNSKGLLLSMHIGKHFSKPNPDIFQKRLLLRYEKTVTDIFKYYELSRYC
jgi:hypothetical protein